VVGSCNDVEVIMPMADQLMLVPDLITDQLASDDAGRRLYQRVGLLVAVYWLGLSEVTCGCSLL